MPSACKIMRGTFTTFRGDFSRGFADLLMCNRWLRYPVIRVQTEDMYLQLISASKLLVLINSIDGGRVVIATGIAGVLSKSSPSLLPFEGHGTCWWEP